MSGKSTIRGMRFPIKDMLELLANGMIKEEILEQHPCLEKDDIEAALFYASLNLKITIFVDAA